MTNIKIVLRTCEDPILSSANGSREGLISRVFRHAGFAADMQLFRNARISLELAPQLSMSPS